RLRCEAFGVVARRRRRRRGPARGGADPDGAPAAGGGAQDEQVAPGRLLLLAAGEIFSEPACHSVDLERGEEQRLAAEELERLHPGGAEGEIALQPGGERGLDLHALYLE